MHQIEDKNTTKQSESKFESKRLIKMNNHRKLHTCDEPRYLCDLALVVHVRVKLSIYANTGDDYLLSPFPPPLLSSTLSLCSVSLQIPDTILFFFLVYGPKRQRISETISEQIQAFMKCSGIGKSVVSVFNCSDCKQGLLRCKVYSGKVPQTIDYYCIFAINLILLHAITLLLLARQPLTFVVVNSSLFDYVGFPGNKSKNVHSHLKYIRTFRCNSKNNKIFTKLKRNKTGLNQIKLHKFSA